MKKLDEELVQRKINYCFDNIDLLYQAFTRKSYAEENGGKSNEVLELIGDSVLYMYVTKYLTKRFRALNSTTDDDFDKDSDYNEFYLTNDFNEADITNIRKRLIEREYLAERIDKMGIKDFLYMGKGDVKKHEENQVKVKCDLFEAILGAIAIDCDWDAEYLQNSVEFMLDIDKYLQKNLETDDNFMMFLQQWTQKEYGDVPHYEIVQNYYGTPTAYVTIETSNGEMRFEGSGKNATQAKTEAAQSAYKWLEDNDELFTIMDEITEKITTDNAINKLQELADKGYFSKPQYYQQDEQTYDEDGNPVWKCSCYVSSYSLEKIAKSASKKGAKKYSAYLVLINILGFKNEYEDEE